MALGKQLSAQDAPSTALLPFVAISFAITWGLISFYVFFPELAVSMFGPISGSHPFFFLATWGPAFAAFILVAIYGRWAGIKLF